MSPAQTVVEQNSTKGVSPTAVLRNPNRRTGGEQLPFVKRRALTIFSIFFTFD